MLRPSSPSGPGRLRFRDSISFHVGVSDERDRPLLCCLFQPKRPAAGSDPRFPSTGTLPSMASPMIRPRTIWLCPGPCLAANGEYVLVVKFAFRQNRLRAFVSAHRHRPRITFSDPGNVPPALFGQDRRSCERERPEKFPPAAPWSMATRGGSRKFAVGVRRWSDRSSVKFGLGAGRFTRFSDAFGARRGPVEQPDPSPLFPASCCVSYQSAVPAQKLSRLARQFRLFLAS